MRTSLLLQVLFFALLVVPSAVMAIETKQAQLNALEAILLEVETHYGMSKFKEEQFGVSVKSLRKKYRRLVREAKTLEEDLGWDEPVNRKVLPPDEFRQLLIGMAAEFRDGHTNLSRLAKTAAHTGLVTAAIDERLFVTAVSDDLYVKGSGVQDVQVGDEIIAVNGVSVSELAQRNLLYMQSGTFEARYQEALEFILVVPFALLRRVQEGDLVEVTFKRNGQEMQARLHWVETADLIKFRQLFPQYYKHPAEGAAKDKEIPFGYSGMVRTHFRTGLMTAVNPASIVDVGDLVNMEIQRQAQEKMEQVAKNPQMAMMAQQSQVKPVTRLPAYMIRHKDKNIGVIRVPSYSPGGFDSMLNEYMWLAEVVKRMEAMTDVLIIDQLSNSGGSVYHALKLISLLADPKKPIKSISADLRLSETLLSVYSSPEIPADPETGQKPNYAELRLSDLELKRLRDKKNRGEKWSGMIANFASSVELTEGETGRVYPSNKGSYSKPILVLNDSRSASGGDFVPGILQANGRAVIFGETSKGLGGPVYRNTGSMPGSEVEFRCTMAYCERSDGLPLENIGTLPNIRREVTPADLRGGFTQYAQDALNAAYQLAQGASTDEIQMAVSQGAAAALGTSLDAQTKELKQGLDDVVEKFFEMPFFQDPEFELESSTGVAETGYKIIFDAIEKVDDRIEAEKWNQVIIPLPLKLKMDDLILSSLWRKEEVLARLEEMLELPQWKKHPQTKALMSYIIERSRSVKAQFRFADSCSALLTFKQAHQHVQAKKPKK